MNKELIKYWWENKIEILLKEYQENNYTSDADIKLLILKIIETEINTIKQTSF